MNTRKQEEQLPSIGTFIKYGDIIYLVDKICDLIDRKYATLVRQDKTETLVTYTALADCEVVGGYEEVEAV